VENPEIPDDLKNIAIKPKKNPRIKKETQEKKETFGTWYYLDDILTTLDSYFKTLKKFKAYDPESYEMYGKIGGQVVSRKSLFELHHLPASWADIKSRPSFGMVHFAYEPGQEEERVCPNLLYFRKYKSLWFVKPTNHDLYEFRMFYLDKKKSEKFTMVCAFHVAVTADRQIIPLKEKINSRIHIKPKSRNGGGSYTVQEWKIPDSLQIFYEDAKENNPELIQGLSKEEAISQIASQLFKFTACMAISASGGLLVRAKDKVGLTAAFCVDMLRTPYFFKDREKTITVNGSKRKIFHIVRTHKRKMYDGTEKDIKSHFRGERKFMWNGYSINITMPGFHHNDWNFFSAAAEDFDINTPTPKGMVDLNRFAEILDNHLTNA